MNEMNENEETIGILNANTYIYNGQIIKFEDPDDLIVYCDDSSADIEYNESNSDNNYSITIKNEPDDADTDAASSAVDEFNETLPKIKVEQIEPDFTNFEIKTEPEFIMDTESVKSEPTIETDDVPIIPSVEENLNCQMSHNEIPKIKISTKYFRENVENVVDEKKPKIKKSKIQKSENNFSDFFKFLEDLAETSDNITDVILSKTQEVERPASTSSESMEDKTENDCNLSNTESGATPKIRWVIKRGPKRKNEEDNNTLLSLQAELNQSTYLDKLLDSSVEQKPVILPEMKRNSNEYLTDHSDSNSNSATQSQPNMKLVNQKKSVLRHKCTECPESFAIARMFEIHMEHVHHIKPYKCMYCPKEFARSKYLRYHTARHTGENLIKCTECDGEFARKIDYQRHKESHFGIVHKCNECDKAFTRLSNLNMHIKKHMGIKPFVCDICSKVFYRESGFRRHKEAHETRNMERLCGLCNRQFETIEDFLKHCNVNHVQAVTINDSK